MDDIPVIDVSALINCCGDVQAVAEEIGRACRKRGFFYIVGHGVSRSLQEQLHSVSQEFFAQALDDKLRIRMELGGHAWRGYFPVGDELTSGKPDQKEGIYFGSELPNEHPMVKAGVPLHGANLFPEINGFRDTILEYIERLTDVGHALMRGIAQSLQLDSEYFRQELTTDPILLFRIFHYPPLDGPTSDLWSVGEHTDYGLLTILKQDAVGGLQVQSQGEWIDAPPIPDSFVCNIGDILDRMTGGYYRSTPHRVRNRGARDRYSFPFFFDPGWDAQISPIDVSLGDDITAVERWDGAKLDQLGGTYGEYLLGKVAKVFPDLSKQQLD